MSGGGEEHEQQQQKAPLPGVSSASTSSAAAALQGGGEATTAGAGTGTGAAGTVGAGTAGTGGGNGRATPEMKRSAVRNLIQRYFHQLQSGCGNAQCSNANCASSGKVAPMTPNEVAARALQLLSQDAQLCNSPTPSLAPAANSPHQDVDMLSPNDSSSSSSSSSSSTSTITSASTTTTTSTQSQSQPQKRPPMLIDMLQLTTPATTTTAATDADTVAVAESEPDAEAEPETSETPPATSSGNDSGARTPTLTPAEFLDADTLEALYEECVAADSYDRLQSAICHVFSSVERLSKSFRCRPGQERRHLLAKSTKTLNKEQLRQLEGEHDKDEDSTQRVETRTETETVHEYRNEDAELNETENTHGDNDSDDVEDEEDEDEPMDPSQHELNDKFLHRGIKIDFLGLRRIKRLLFGAPCQVISENLTNSVIQLTELIRSLSYRQETWETFSWEQAIHCLVICFDMATNTTANNSVTDMEYLDRVLPRLCHATATIPVKAQARLALIWGEYCPDQLQSLLSSCQQQITLLVLLNEEGVRENAHIISLTKVLKIVFYANILASVLERPSCRLPLQEVVESEAAAAAAAAANEEGEDLFAYSSLQQPHMPKFAEDPLEKFLKVSFIDCRSPLVPLEEFYNEALSEHIQMHQDYLSYKTLAMESELGSSHTNYFCFMLYAFILTPATKVDALYYDCRMRMYSERYSSLYSILHNYGQDGQEGARPDLKLTVRRDQLINDALIGLELVAMSNPKDLKKQLVVEFVGEQGIDEGGVSKEFFQLIVEEIFNPAFGMFVQEEETNNMWFNATPFENGAQFTLIGIIIGLAIYNNVILAVNFPMVVYRKLMGYRGTFYDLSDWSPTLYKSLNDMLDYQGHDMEEVFEQTFKISYSNVFGELVEHELVPHGSEVLVGQHNKRLFVNLYSDFLLNVNIQQQFNAFRKGFEMVTDESPLKLLFRPEEIEKLVCGSREFDFVELEHSTEYEGGYTEETQIVQDFWSIVHAMPHESKRKLLEFTTGSDRVPVGGLKCLRLMITRHGPDSDRLPTSHTCFNVLLLPEYSSKEKLEERLLKAINYSKGFGML
ncbi:ubiquitin-protein ligase E3A [Drosophila grimshawi]|uniref:Ubiquitin-protein ligase E3A n=1 Tax=Drosophila grimshawi TaxID=7222 RepID=B4J2V6_DROGR|nr:ubiquitin-protein ligase E3A [Drosophila grimshawi]EDV97126.1 GH16658 [Drosophila grimshawi]